MSLQTAARNFRGTHSTSTYRIPRLRKALLNLLLVVEVFTFCYVGLAAYVAMRVEYTPPLPITKTPTACGLAYQNVTFDSREDHIRLSGWFIPRVLAHGQLTDQRTLIMVLVLGPIALHRWCLA